VYIHEHRAHTFACINEATNSTFLVMVKWTKSDKRGLSSATQQNVQPCKFFLYSFTSIDLKKMQKERKKRKNIIELKNFNFKTWFLFKVRKEFDYSNLFFYRQQLIMPYLLNKMPQRNFNIFFLNIILPSALLL